MRKAALSVLSPALVAGVLTVTGCVRYLEEETPPGEVPPPGPVTVNRPHGQVPPPAGPAARPAPAPAERPGAPGAGTAPPASPAPTAATAPPEEIGFAATYLRLGSPRMIVYATESFGGEVDEWRPERRTVGRVETEAGDREARTDLDVGTVRGVAPPASDPSDDEITFERSFVARLVDAGVAVIDRDVILRREALPHQDVDALTQTVLSEPVVESYALEHNVELLVTVDLLEDRRSPCTDRRYLATVKDLATGRVLATADSVAAAERFRTTEVVGTSEGYRRRIRVEPYGCSDLAGALAEELMDALARSPAV